MIDLNSWLTTGFDVAVLEVQSDAWKFSHDKLREGLLNALSETERPVLHRCVAQAIEKVYSEASEQVATLAYLWGVAGGLDKELHYSRLAGEQSVKANANAEAIGHLNRALELLARLPESPERDQQELALQIILGPPLVLTQGYAAPDVAGCYNRALDLCNKMGATPQLIPILLQLGTVFYIKAEYETALELGRRMLLIEERNKDPVIVTSTRLMNVMALYITGNFKEARAHLECGLAAYDPEQYSYYARVYGHDTGVSLLNFHSLVQLWQGYPDQAKESSMEAIELARDLDHPYILALALHSSGAIISNWRREYEAAQVYLNEVLALCTEYNFPFYKAWGAVSKGWALTEQGEHREGILFLQQGIAALRAMGSLHAVSYVLGILAEGFMKTGQREEGSRTISEALITAKETGELLYEPALRTLHGELLEMQSASLNEIEQCFTQAVSMAHRIGAKWCELRAVMSLCRFWQKQGKSREAREKLADIYNWFTEGFDTKDLQEAKALLEELQ